MKFISLLKNSPKVAVKIFVGERDGETDDYADEIKTTLDAANGKNNPIVELGDVRIPNHIGQTIQDFPFAVCVYATNEDWESIALPGVTFTQDIPTLQTMYAFDTNDVRAVMCMVDNAFQGVGINPVLLPNNTFLKPGEWGIFVPKKF
jgi:hypothetical protein